jgi:2-hydroxychromene-2-carboxylate isomerase
MTEKMPDGFPPLTLTIMRALCALTVLHPGKGGQGLLIAMLDELYKAFWVEHRKTNEKDVLAEILEKVLGPDDTKRGMFLPVPFH